MGINEDQLLRQHLIDPEICIRCNTCEATCPVGAITHDSRNYVVDAEKCNLCMACVPPCPTGSIDNWRAVPKARVYSITEQFDWDELPAELSNDQLAEMGVSSADETSPRLECSRALGGYRPGGWVRDGSLRIGHDKQCTTRRHIAPLVGCSSFYQSVWSQSGRQVHYCDSGRQCTRH